MHAERWVGTDERHLQRREVDDARDLVLVEGVLDGVEVGDVARHELDPAGVVSEYQVEATAVVAEVVADHRVSVVEHASGDPGAEAAQGTGDEDSLRQAGRPGRR